MLNRRFDPQPFNIPRNSGGFGETVADLEGVARLGEHLVVRGQRRYQLGGLAGQRVRIGVLVEQSPQPPQPGGELLNGRTGRRAWAVRRTASSSNSPPAGLIPHRTTSPPLPLSSIVRSAALDRTEGAEPFRTTMSFK